jgi:hypothetical protein
LSINHKPPRQDRRNVKHAPVKKHQQQHSVGTLPPGNSFTNPGSAKGTRMALLSQSGQFK